MPAEKAPFYALSLPEKDRKRILLDYQALAAGAQKDLDAITQLASTICCTKISLISLLDNSRQWIASQKGISLTHMPLERAICTYTLREGKLLEIPDIRQQQAGKGLPGLLENPELRFYAGVPLITPEGLPIGTLCVADPAPGSLNTQQRAALEMLAGQVISHLETRRHQNEAEQENTRLKLYQLLFNHSTELMCMLDSESGTFIEVNAAFDPIMGYAPQELVGKPIADYLHPEDLAFLNNFLENLSHHGPISLNSRFYRKDGSLRWLSWTASGHNGKWFAMGRDITELKKIGSEKIDVQQLLVSLLEHSPSGIYALKSIRNAAGEIVDFEVTMQNPAAQQYNPVAAQVLTGQRLMAVLSETDREVVFPLFKKVVETKKPHLHEHSFHFGPEPTWIQVVASKLDDGLVVVTNDISSSKNAALNLERQKTFYESILNEMMADVAVIDAQFRYLFVNPNAIRNPAIREWIIGKDDFEYCRYRNKDIAIAQNRRNKFHQAIREKRRLEWEEEFILPDGDKVFNLRTLSPIFDGQGQLQRMIGFGMDITQRKKQEQELMMAKEQAVESMRAKEMFLSMMSHEIRTPLNAVVGMSHLLLQEDPRPDQVENLKILQFAGENLLTLINDILDFNKIDSGKIDFEQIDFGFLDLLNGLRQTFTHRAREKGIRLRTSLDDALPEILRGDPVRLNQILMNLISNALKFTESGSVTLDVSIEKEDSHQIEVCFCITDTGIGIPADKLEAIFESFTQGNSDTTRKFGGTGLGLTITKKLVEMQQGQIQVASSLGQGTSFTVRLTFGKSQAKTLPVSTRYLNTTACNLGHVRLLLVEDNEVNQVIATKFLNKWGLQPEIVGNGQQALQAVQQQEFDLVLMDLQMPEMDGYEASRQIRNLGGKYASLPIIALTASAMMEVREKVMQYGMNDYVTKPFNPNELYQKIYRLTHPNPGPPPEPVTKPASAPEPVLFNLAGLDDLIGNDAAARRQILDHFISSLREFIANYRHHLLEAPDIAKVRFINHRIKASLNMIQAEELMQEIAQAESCLQGAEPLQQAARSVARVTRLTESIIAGLEENQ